MLSKNIKMKIYKNRCLALVLHGCKTWSVTLKEGHRFGLSKNGMMRKIFGLMWKVVIWNWRRMHFGSFII
jgi:hypothetical protein